MAPPCKTNANSRVLLQIACTSHEPPKGTVEEEIIPFEYRGKDKPRVWVMGGRVAYSLGKEL